MKGVASVIEKSDAAKRMMIGEIGHANLIAKNENAIGTEKRGEEMKMIPREEKARGIAIPPQLLEAWNLPEQENLSSRASFLASPTKQALLTRHPIRTSRISFLAKCQPTVLHPLDLQLLVPLHHTTVTKVNPSCNNLASDQISL
jgi:hypothetical protein